MDLQAIKTKIQEKRDMIIVVLTVIVVLLLTVIGTKMQKGYGTRKQLEEEALRAPEKVTLQTTKQTAGNERQGGMATTSYFLRPSAEELLTIIREMGQAQLPQQNQKYVGFNVMWPCYFFQVKKTEGSRVTVVFDVSEDGFGATIVSDIDSARFPEILQTERGKKVWLAGEIVGIDPTGTGTVHIISDEIRFEDPKLGSVDSSEGGTPPEESGQAKQ